jgi:concanavalin A-like lectin/glucanase superfamily protein
MKFHRKFFGGCHVVLCVLLLAPLTPQQISAQTKESLDPLTTALTFHASFDHGVDADFAAGDPILRHAPSMKQRAEAKPGLPESGEVQVALDAGRFGHALRFTRKKSPMVFFRAAKNVAYRTNDWSGTVSFWLSVDPVGELEPGFCDPIQITPRAWNDAAFFVEFEKRTNDIPFRLGAYSDFNVWNPNKRKWEEIPFAEKPLATVPKPPFTRGKWTHVAFAFEHFNTGRDDGLARLYLDGALVATLGPRRQTFTWDEDQCLVMLGLSYIGLWDELAIFNRALTAQEVRQLHGLRNGVRDLGAGRKPAN